MTDADIFDDRYHFLKGFTKDVVIELSHWSSQERL